MDASTTAISGPIVTVLEGDSVDISCTSTGVPTPSITWSFNGTAAPFNQTDTVVDYRVTILAANDFTVDPGVITSELHIVSASYPDHDGEYTCVGVNSEDAVFTSSSAFITVQVQGITYSQMCGVVSTHVLSRFYQNTDIFVIIILCIMVQFTVK